MSQADFDCKPTPTPGDPYVKKALCARAWGGAPDDYVESMIPIGDGEPVDPSIISGNGSVECSSWLKDGNHSLGGPSPQDDPDTSIDESTAIIKNMWRDPFIEHYCDACRVCDEQNVGWNSAGHPIDEWNDYPWCPGKGVGEIDYVAFNAFWDNGCILPDEEPTGGEDPTGGEESTGDVPDSGTWMCIGAQQICGIMTDSFPDPDEDQTICM